MVKKTWKRMKPNQKPLTFKLQIMWIYKFYINIFFCTLPVKYLGSVSQKTNNFFFLERSLMLPKAAFI